MMIHDDSICICRFCMRLFRITHTQAFTWIRECEYVHERIETHIKYTHTRTRTPTHMQMQIHVYIDIHIHVYIIPCT